MQHLEPRALGAPAPSRRSGSRRIADPLLSSPRSALPARALTPTHGPLARTAPERQSPRASHITSQPHKVAAHRASACVHTTSRHRRPCPRQWPRHSGRARPQPARGLTPGSASARQHKPLPIHARRHARHMRLHAPSPHSPGASTRTRLSAATRARRRDSARTATALCSNRLHPRRSAAGAPPLDHALASRGLVACHTHAPRCYRRAHRTQLRAACPHPHGAAAPGSPASGAGPRRHRSAPTTQRKNSAS